MLLTMGGHMIYAGGYLLSHWQTTWSVQVLYPITFLEALGGGEVGITSSANSYLSDITCNDQRTSYMIISNSVGYLGGSLGTVVAALMIRHTGYHLPLAIALMAYFAATVYIIFCVRESNGPLAKKTLNGEKFCPLTEKLPKMTKLTMVQNLFDWRRAAESLKTVFRKREGNKRALLIVAIVANSMRRVSRGNCFFFFF